LILNLVVAAMSEPASADGETLLMAYVLALDQILHWKFSTGRQFRGIGSFEEAQSIHFTPPSSWSPLITPDIVSLFANVCIGAVELH
jgi:hypothetical protein